MPTDSPALPVLAAPSAPRNASAGAAGTLGLLFLVYVFNYLDRSLIFILFQPIKAELALTELQLALLGSTSFVLFYTTLGLPFGRLAERASRTRMIAGGLALWSAASALTGAMHDFPSLFCCRVLVGVGEATLGPAALSLLSDLFPPRQRATVSAAFSAGIPVGAGAALLCGGLLAARYGWRQAFFACGLPGVALAALVLTLREPVRGGSERPVAAPDEPGWAALHALLRTPALPATVAGYAFFAVASNALSMWVPTLLVRVHGLPLAQAGLRCGLIATAAGLVGVLAGGALADRWRARVAGGRLRFTAVAAAACVPLWLALLHARSAAGVLVPFAGLVALGLAWLGPAAADVQDLAGVGRRSTAIGAYFFVVNAIGYGLAPPLIGWLSDVLGVARDATVMRTSLLLCPAAALAAAAVLYVSARRIEHQY
jgi:MFS family permease